MSFHISLFTDKNDNKAVMGKWASVILEETLL